MASLVMDTSFFRCNSKLETFLKRNVHRDVQERIRYYEACVVVSEELDKVFMQVMLTDDSVYLTEHHPKTLIRALHFSLILHIELINDLPNFLRGKDQEQSLHIRIVHTRMKDQAKPQPAATPCKQVYSHSGSLTGISGVQQSPEWKPSTNRDAGDECKLNRQSSRKTSVLSRLKQKAAGERKKKNDGEEKNEAELHLYAVMISSQIYVHLKRSWNSYIMRSTLMLSPCTPLSPPSSKKHKPKISWERKCQLFSQLSGELLQQGLSLEDLYLLLQELCTAARHNPDVKTLLWRSPELYPFLVKTLTDSVQLSEDKLHAADRLLLSTLVVQTIGLMFGETEKEVARFSTLTSKQGSMTADLLQVLVCDPELKSNNCDPASHTELQVLQAEYLDAASSLLFEVMMFCQETSWIPKVGHFLTVAWVFQTLNPHPFLLLFMAYQAQRVILALSCASDSALSPLEAVLLYQRCWLLLTCMQHNTCVNTYIITELREEFRYYVRQSELEGKLPSYYPISRPVTQLLSQLLSLLLDRP